MTSLSRIAETRGTCALCGNRISPLVPVTGKRFDRAEELQVALLLADEALNSLTVTGFR